MSSRLSKATSTARKGLIAFLIFAISTFIFRFIFELTDSPDNVTQPQNTNKSAYLAEDRKLGEIPYPSISPLATQASANITYSIQDRDILPEFPPVLNVYEINKPREKLGNVAKGRQVATNLEINTPERTIAENTLLWQSSDTVRSLSYNKLLETWAYTTDITKERYEPQIANKLKTNTTQDYYSEKGLAVLNLLTLSDSFFTSANSRIDYVNTNNNFNTITTAESPKDSMFVRIAQYKRLPAAELLSTYKPLENEVAKLPLFGDVRKINYTDGVVNMIVRGNATETVPDIVSFSYHQFNYGSRGVYTSLSSKDSFVQLQNGKGTLYWLKLKGENPYTVHTPLSVLEYKVDAPQTKIIYIEPDEWNESQQWTNFLQPFFIFEGTAILTDGREADFSIILPALAKNEYVK